MVCRETPAARATCSIVGPACSPERCRTFTPRPQRACYLIDQIATLQAISLVEPSVVKGYDVADAPVRSSVSATPGRTLQPLLHDLVSCVRAPSLALSADDGQIRPGGVQGWLRHDRRLLTGLTVEVSGQHPDGLVSRPVGSAGASFTAVARHLGDDIADPTVTVERLRRLVDGHLEETVTVCSTAQSAVDVELVLTASSDLAPIGVVKSGQSHPVVVPDALPDGLAWRAAGLSVRLRADPQPAVDASAGTLSWTTRLSSGQTLRVALVATVEDSVEHPFTEPDRVPWGPVSLHSNDFRVAALVEQSLGDLAGLVLRDGGDPGGDLFLAAGSPWFLTLFGRDSLWSARMLLPLGTELAMGTLRTLGRRQGGADVPETEEQAGKILHEVRESGLDVGDLALPPVYFGTVDATPLWVTLLAEAWHWGAPSAEVAALLPVAERCLAWLETQAQDGFLRYADRSGHGLANQGWKDSADSIQWADGRLAEAPIALSEVQGYAHEAALNGAALLDAFGRPGGDRWRDWAEGLRARFRSRFWVADGDGAYPAIALDRHDRAVDSVASNMAHLLGTGILAADEVDLVAGRLASPDLDSGFGLRTLTRRSPRFSRLSYHGGTVWPHDTAIAARGLAREGQGAAAARLFGGLVEAGPTFGYRLPELYGGDAPLDAPAPIPYPAACRPQAWSAAGVVGALVALLGLDPDVPSGVVRVGRGVPPFAPLSLDGLRIGGEPAAVEVDADGQVSLSTTAPVTVLPSR
ncbi:MAG: amylo-alpha-1,6-glucosidase [Propionibacteriales bacterium]|nr:amylo-alpha-1,6-glucosidase [Propionibacteriales bacterium]